ncbi:phosphoribosylglycinamide formyltransferase [Oceanobacillus sp. CAU 1775]
MSKVKVAVFASGTGSNFDVMIKEANLPCEIALLVCDQPQAAVIDKAKNNNVKTYISDLKKFDSKVAYETAILKELQTHNIEWIFLAGYMRLVGKTLLTAYEGRIINIHPSLLPAFPGLDAIGQAFEAGVDETGVSIHYVDEGMDTGPIIAQEAVPVFPEDTKETLQKRIQAVEHRLYPKVMKELLQK